MCQRIVLIRTITGSNIEVKVQKNSVQRVQYWLNLRCQAKAEKFAVYFWICKELLEIY